MKLPNVDINLLEKPSFESVQPVELAHPPRFLLLYGSNRETSYSRLAVMEAGLLLEYYGYLHFKVGFLKISPYFLA